MRFITKTWLVLVTVALAHGIALAASFSSSLDRDSMTLGEQATLSLKFVDVQPQDAPGIPNIPGLQFQYVGPSSEFNIVNGQSSSSITFRYIVTAQHDGEFTIPAMQTTIDGKRLTCEALKLVVGKAAAPSAADVAAGRQPAFMKLRIPEGKVYVGQSILGYLDLYLRDDVQGVNGFQLTSTPTDGFVVGKMAEQQDKRQTVRIGNRQYNVIPLALPLTAMRPGPLTLGPVTASVTVGVVSQNQGGDPFFGMFRHVDQQQVGLTTEAASVQVLPLPDQNKPPGFNGAIGNFTMSATAGPTTVTVGDPITVRVQISGRGAMDTVTLPAQKEGWTNFKTYPATTKLENSDQFGFSGTKTFEQIVSPENADVHELPPISFSFFNPDDGQYHTLTQAAVPLAVKAAGSTPVPSLAGAKNASSENQPTQDIGPIKEQLGTLTPAGAPLVVQPVFVATQSLPVLAFFAALIWRKRTDSLANNPRLRRQRAVAQLMASGLDDLKKYAAANQPDEFFATLFRLLQEQLGERLDCPASAITENVVEEHPLLRRAPAALRDALREQFQLCNQARYAPVRGTSELNSVANQFQKLINQLQELK